MAVSRFRSRSHPVPLAPFVPLSSLEQAEICREQARDAARLRRFKAAFGLFSTAAALCRHALASGADADQATACLRSIDSEMAAYSELARSMDKPLAPRLIHAGHAVHSFNAGAKRQLPSK